MQNVIIILANVTILLTFCSGIKGLMLPVYPDTAHVSPYHMVFKLTHFVYSAMMEDHITLMFTNVIGSSAAVKV